MYGNPYAPIMPSSYGYGAQNSFYNQPNTFASGTFGQSQQVPQPQPNNAITVAQVPTIEHVDQVQMMPGDRKIILVQNAPVIAIKVADQMGLVQTEYRHTEPFDPHQMQTPSAQPQYAPLSEFEQLKSEIINLRSELNAIKGGSTNGKSSKQSVPSGNSSNASTTGQSRQHSSDA